MKVCQLNKLRGNPSKSFFFQKKLALPGSLGLKVSRFPPKMFLCSRQKCHLRLDSRQKISCSGLSSENFFTNTVKIYEHGRTKEKRFFGQAETLEECQTIDKKEVRLGIP